MPDLGRCGRGGRQPQALLVPGISGVSTWDGPFHLIGGATYLHSSFDGSVAIPIFDGLALCRPFDSQDSREKLVGLLQSAYDITRDLSLTVSGR